MTATTNRSGRLTKTLGFGRLSLYGVGTMIGAGIYSVIGPAAGSAGEAIWISFLVATLINIAGVTKASSVSAVLTTVQVRQQGQEQQPPRPSRHGAVPLQQPLARSCDKGACPEDHRRAGH